MSTKKKARQARTYRAARRNAMFGKHDIGNTFPRLTRIPFYRLSGDSRIVPKNMYR